MSYFKLHVKLSNLALPTHSTFISGRVLQQRFIPQVQIVRERKRSSRAPSWFMKKKDKGAFYFRKELTDENRAFIQEVVEDRYLPQLESPLKDEPWPRNPWTTSTKRTGVLAIKIGAFPQWKKDGTKIYTTLLQVLDNHVIRYTPPEEFHKYEHINQWWRFKNYGAVVVGALSTDPQMFTKAYCGLFKDAGVPPKRKLTRFLVTPNAAIQPGTPLKATHFKVGDYVDVQAKTIGHGFQGVVKRWGFKGGPATHGSTKFHRRPGSLSAGLKKMGVWKGKKMPGHMGMDWRHLRGLKIWRINTQYNVLYVNGPVTPGPAHCYVRVFDTALRYRRDEMFQDPPYMPTFYPDLDASEPLPEEIFHEDLFQFDQDTITYDEAKS